VRTLLQSVFDNALAKMKSEDREAYEMNSLRSASAHWLRHTSATFDAPFRKAKDLQLDLRHSNLSTTQDTYYHSHDQERMHSICSGQLIPDTTLSFSSARAGASPPLN
jgi:integrase